MTDLRPIEEQDLHAYVDGRLETERHGHVEQYLGQHPEAKARIQGWQAADEAVRAALAWRAEEPVPASLGLSNVMQVRMTRRRAPWRVAASLVVGLAAGSAAGWYARGPETPTGLAALGNEAMAASRTFAADPTHPVEFGPAQSAQLVDWAAQHFGRQVAPPDLTGSGYELLGGRLVATEHGAACMFIYANAAGQRVSLFVRPMERRDLNAAMRPIGGPNLAGYAWARDGMGFSLTSTGPGPVLHDLSKQVQDALERGA